MSMAVTDISDFSGRTPLPLACTAHPRNLPHRLRLQTDMAHPPEQTLPAESALGDELSSVRSNERFATR